MTTIELRRLALADLLAIEEIERRSYPTPWSRSMFAGELAKPSSICLGAFEAEGEDGALVGYLIVSRYVDAWHVMNVAVDPGPPRSWRRDDAARAALRPHGRRRPPRLHARGARLERQGDLPLRAPRLPLARPAARLLHGQPRGRADHVEGPGRRANKANAAILGIETSCDETAAALVTRTDEIRSSVVSSQAELHARYGGVVPEVASRRHLELVTPVIREALAEADATPRGRRPRRGDPRARADRRAPRRARRGEGGRVVAPAAARPRRPPRRPRRLALSPAGAARAAVPLPAGERRPHDAARRPLAHRAGAARVDARRRGGRGVRQGRAAARARLSGRARDRPARARGRPRRVRLPRRARAGPRLLLLGPEDGAPVRGPRPRARRSSRRAAPISPPRTSTRSCGRSSSACGRLRSRPAGSGSRSSAASPRTRRCGPRSRTRPRHRSPSAPTTRR